MSDKFYTLKDISCLLQTPIPYLRKLIKEHKLKGKLLDRHYIVSDEKLKRFINSLRVKIER